ncbi:1,2-phenylacetyl-CoA epoxidase subunit PaaD [Streptomyces sp. NPDC005303]|uniref:1,2-phenylacetyl-CoA epoxidase subunit PaaD n=1 Tax=Streptomyces sp. NPDC005303 TaxID=3155713 RepID=UPI0033AADD32
MVTPSERAWRTAREVPDPELPMLTISDLGVLRGVEVAQDGTVVARLTPTYSGCPAMAEMRAEVAARLRAAGFPEVEVVTALDPPWTTDWISAEGGRKLTAHGIAPPGARQAPDRGTEPVRLPMPLFRPPASSAVPCPRCASPDTEEISHFGSTACTALRRCHVCLEPFEHIKDL